jgi:hypothetical protein
MGMDISEKGGTIPLWKKKPKRCVLMDELKCSYFETAILAGIPMMSNEKNQIEAEEAESLYNERNKPHEFGLSQRSLVGAGSNGAIRLQEDIAPKTHAGTRSARNKIAGRSLRLSGRGRDKVAG